MDSYGLIAPRTQLTLIPAPKGYVQNLVNPNCQQHGLDVVCIVLLVVAVLFVSLRLYTRARIVNAVGWDDYASIMAMLSSIASCTLVIKMNQNRNGCHLWDVPVDILSRWNKYQWIHIMLYYWTVMFAKLVFLLLYIRIFPKHKGLNRAVWVSIAVVVAYTLAIFLARLLGVHPIRANYVVGLKVPIHRVNLAGLNVAISVLNLCIDFLILFLPVRMVWSLKIPTRQKFGVGAVFMIGIFVCLTTTLRMVFTIKGLGVIDFTRVLFPSFYWAVVEMNTGIICGCMPALKPLIRLVLPNLLGRTTAHTGTDSSRRSTGLKRSTIQSSSVTQDTYLELGEYAGNGRHVEGNETYAVGQENDSRERIIVGPDGGIMKTETVGVEVSRPEKTKQDGRALYNG